MKTTPMSDEDLLVAVRTMRFVQVCSHVVGVVVLMLALGLAGAATPATIMLDFFILISFAFILALASNFATSARRTRKFVISKRRYPHDLEELKRETE